VYINKIDLIIGKIKGAWACHDVLHSIQLGGKEDGEGEECGEEQDDGQHHPGSPLTNLAKMTTFEHI
jgi:hypothetical protein